MRISSIFGFALLLCLNVSAACATEELFGQLDQNQDGQIAPDELDPSHERLFDRLLRISDENQDGQLSASEFLAGLAPQHAVKPLVKKQGSEMPGASALLLLLAKMDTNANGEIEAEEVPRQYREVFQRIEDRVGGEPDGLLSRRELNQSAPMLSFIASRMAERMGLDVELELALLSEKQWQAAQNMTGSRSRGQALADPKRAREFFKQLDANGDGQVTLEEVPEQAVERFEQLLDRADRNGDDQISEQELMTVSRFMQARASNQSANKQRPKEVAKEIERMLKRLDRNGDRRVSRKEAPRRMAGRFDQLDTDGSGYLERKEIAAIVETLSGMRRPEAKSPARSKSKKESKN